jgi:hypothetical protein
VVKSLEPDGDALALLERVVAEADEASDHMTACLLRPVAVDEARAAVDADRLPH